MAGFPRSARLLKPAEFKQVLSAGRRNRSASFTAVEFQGPTDGQPRLGLTVSKKALPLSVARNRFKRITRESFRQQQGLPPCQVVIMATPAARNIDGRSLAAELNRYWERLRNRWPAS